MELISFNDICKFIKTSLVDGNYGTDIIAKWDSVFVNGSFVDDWQYDIETVGSLCSFLRAVVGVRNETEDQVVLHAITYAFKASAEFNS